MIKFSLVGCGRIAKRHSDLLGGSKIDGAQLVSVCDINLNKAKVIGDKFQIPYYSSQEEMLEKTDCNVVVILTESGNHARDAIVAAKNKKHVVVEKPMALTLEDADLMIKECETNEVKLFVVKQNRFNLPVIKLKEAIDHNRFGKKILGTVRVRWCRDQSYYDQDAWRGTWQYDGGVLTNQASHHIDLLEWMMGEVDCVFAYSAKSLANIEAEDTAVVSLKFKSGAIGLIEATTATRPKDLEGSISILGEGGSVEIGGFAVNEMKVWNFVESLDEDEDVIKNYSVNPPDVYGFGHKEYYNHVVDCLSNNKKLLVDGSEGRKSLELINAIYESIETGNQIYLNTKPNFHKLGRKK